MKLDYIWSGNPGEDCVDSCAIYFQDGMTIDSLLTYILEERSSDWGNLYLKENFTCSKFIEYSHGKISFTDVGLYKLVKDFKVARLEGRGGRSKLDYYISIGDEELTKLAKVAEET